jgi:hypothetical protein
MITFIVSLLALNAPVPPEDDTKATVDTWASSKATVEEAVSDACEAFKIEPGRFLIAVEMPAPEETHVYLTTVDYGASPL